MFETCENCGGPVIPRHCPHCGARRDGHTEVDPSSGVVAESPGCPKPDDVSICLYCSAISIYTETGLRIPNNEEMDSILAQEDTQAVIWAIAEMRAAGRIPPCR